MKYKVIEGNIAPELAKIEKSEITAEITLGETLSAIEYNKKGMQTLESEISLKKAIMVNVSGNYPGVLDIEEKLLLAAHTYLEAKKYVEIAEMKLGEFKGAQADLEQEVKDIEEQTGLVKIPVEKRIEIVSKLQADLGGK
jgi:tetratricopeptide (TPR) repeat protein